MIADSKAKLLGFGFLKKFGKNVLHLFVISMCLGLTVCCIFGADRLSMRHFYKPLQIILYPTYYYLVLNYLSAYVMAIFTDPGRPPFNQEDNITPRCKKCNFIKPLRAHHCSICGKCCLRYDHHCPWIANCVGLFNYGYFIKFLGSGFVATSFSLFLELLALITGNYAIQYHDFVRFIVVLTTIVFTIMSILCTSMLLFQHIPMIKHNETTVESYDNDFELRQCKSIGAPFEYPFDKGIKQNLREIFGNKLIHALVIPFYKINPCTDGMSYVSNKNTRL